MKGGNSHPSMKTRIEKLLFQPARGHEQPIPDCTGCPNRAADTLFGGVGKRRGEENPEGLSSPDHQ